MSNSFLSLASATLYLLAGGLLALRLSHGLEAKPSSRFTPLGLALLAWLGHSLALYQGLFSAGGLNLGFSNASSLVTWLMVLLLLVAALARPLENLGIAVFPVAATALALDLLYPSQHVIVTTGDWALKAHILLSILAYSVLTLGAVQAALLAIQDYHLRNRQPGGFIRALPPLQTMESLLFAMIGIGFALLSLSLLSGLLFLQDMFAQHLVHKTVLSIIAWGLFGTLLWGRWRFGWRGRVAIRWTLAGFVLLMLAYFGTKFVVELVLNQ